MSFSKTDDVNRSADRQRQHIQRSIGLLLGQLEKAGAVITAAERPHPMSRAKAFDFARYEIIRIIGAAFETYPELNVQEILDLCEPALIDALVNMHRF